MPKRTRPSAASRAGLALALLAVAAAGRAADTQATDEAAAVHAWRAGRVVEIAGEDGWLTVVGLHWLKPGANRFGRARDNDIVLAGRALAPHAGRLVVDGRSVRLEPAPDSGVTLAGRAAGPAELAPSADGDGVVLASGSLRFFVIERGGRFALRVRDLESPARRAFRGLDYFPIDPSWVVEARFERYEPARRVPIVNVLGDEVEMPSPGAIIFSRDGREWRLDTLLEAPGDDHLFVMFADGTSGHETYGAGRFLHAPLPTGPTLRVDFNESYNPPCAFTGFATCPLPPPQNRLELAVRAGEVRYRSGTH
ncbi:MAG TPA: DUF1684 domain-containing protein [Steroidobacteraceae bacterium]|nr:DUF1684 domain-containing protein [Steroidobacteraceae bacterium]